MLNVRTLLCLGVLIGSVESQAIAPGDYVVASQGTQRGIGVVSAATGAYTTLMPPGLQLQPTDVVMDLDNRNLLFTAHSQRGDGIVRLWPSGYAQRVNSNVVISTATGIDVDRDGSLVVSSRQGLFRIWPRPAGGAVVTLIPGTSWINSIQVDHDTGDYVASDRPATSPGSVLRIDRNTLSVTTLLARLSGVRCIALDPRTGNYVVVTEAWPYVRVYNRALQTVSTPQVPAPPTDVRVAHDTGLYHLVLSNEIRVATSAGQIIRTTRVTAPGVYMTAAEIYASRHVRGAIDTRSSRVTLYLMSVSFPRLPGGSYQILLSLAGQRPGIAVPGGRRINLAPDSLTAWLLLSGDIRGLTLNFRGVLDANGRGVGQLNVPKTVPAGIPFFATAVAVRQGVIRIGNTISFETL